MRRVVVALGGNALLRRGDRLDADVQKANVKEAAAAIAELAEDSEVVITHGNGPQVGLLALESAADTALSRPYPLDVLGAQTEGMIGYLLEQELQNQLPGRQVATLLTQTVVAADDPAFAAPSKPIGPVYDEPTARRLAVERGWAGRPDGRWWRRVVPSPEPRRIVELNAIRTLVSSGVLVVCCGGGGGIPVVRHEVGGLTGVEAVVDKDLAAAVLARALDAEALLLLTDVPAVMRDWGRHGARPIERTTPEELRAMDFASGSMAPKVEAACRFVEQTGGIAAIGQLTDASVLLSGSAGTLIGPSWWDPVSGEPAVRPG